jgi:hypothetical protein
VLGLIRISMGPWWLWAIPLLTLALTVPMVGNPLKRAPLDPVLILVVAAGLVAMVTEHAPANGRYGYGTLGPWTTQTRSGAAPGGQWRPRPRP